MENYFLREKASSLKADDRQRMGHKSPGPVRRSFEDRRSTGHVMGEVVEVIHNERVAWILPDYLATFEQSPRGLQISVCCCGYRVSGVCNGFVPLLSALRVSQDSEMFHCPLRF